MVDCQNGRNKEKVRPRKRWNDVEKDLKIMGIRNRHTVLSGWQKTEEDSNGGQGPIKTSVVG